MRTRLQKRQSTEKLMPLDPPKRGDWLERTIKRKITHLRTFIVKAMVFLVVKYGCEHWTIKKAQHWRIDTFELQFWRRLLRAPWTARRSTVNLKGNQPRILIGRTDADVETPVFWSSDVNIWLIGKVHTAGAEGEEGIRGWDGWMASRMQWTWIWANFRRWWGTERPGMLQSWGHKESDTTGWLNNNNKQRMRSLCLIFSSLITGRPLKMS